MIRNVLLAVVFLGASAMANAATPASDVSGPTLSVSKGTVMVNNGSHFVTAKPGQSLKAGDRIMVMEGGNATLTYANGNKSTVSSGSLVNIGSTPTVKVKKVGPMYAQAVGDDATHCRDSAGNAKKCGGYLTDDRPPLWAVFAGWAVITAVVLNESSADGISQP